MADQSQVGVVVIGRNEGDRLKRCLRSLKDDCPVMVYVDSGSTDGSVEFARSLGVDVVDLDLSRPFTMARGRNTGFYRLCEQYPAIEYVQFVDGDCEVANGWIPAAKASLECDPKIVAVCGRLREKHPEASRYNLLCDLEWDQPEGYAKSCGGIAMFRLAPLREVGGFNESMIAGEEGELCFRLRTNGWKVLRLNEEMAFHDAAMTRLSQWIQRVIRSGHACAEVAFLHGSPPERYKVKELRSIVFWGVMLPLGILVSVVLSAVSGARALVPGFFLLCGYLLLGIRLFRTNRRRGRDLRLSTISTFYGVLAKFPEAIGVVRFWINRVWGRRSELIEYK